MINENRYDLQSNKEVSSPHFINGERKGSVAGRGDSNQSSSEDFDTEDE